MPFIPNAPAATYPAQAAPDSVDFDILLGGFAATGVSSGCAVTAQGTPDMTVAVAVGVVLSAGKQLSVVAGNATIGAAHATLARLDLVVATSAGAKATRAGTAAANPVFPTLTAGDVALAAVYIPAAVTAITTAMITDKRVIVNFSASFGVFDPMNYGAVGNGIANDTTAVQAAADAADAGAGKLYITHPHACNLVVNTSSLKIEGFGQYGPALTPWDITKPVIEYGDTSTAGLRSGMVTRDLNIQAVGPNGTGTIGVRLYAGYENIFDNITFRGFTSHGVYIRNSNAADISLVRFFSCNFQGAADGITSNGALVWCQNNLGTGGVHYTTSLFLVACHFNGSNWTTGSGTGSRKCIFVDDVQLNLQQTYLDCNGENHGIQLAHTTGGPNPTFVMFGGSLDQQNPTSGTIIQVYDNPATLIPAAYFTGNAFVGGKMLSADGTTSSFTLQSSPVVGYQGGIYGGVVQSKLFVAGPTGIQSDTTNATIEHGGAEGRLALLAKNSQHLQLWAGATIAQVTNGGGLYLPQYTLAGRPAAASFPDCLIYVTDAPVSQMLQYSNGAAWLILGSVAALYANAAIGTAINSSTTETALLTGYTVAANELRVGQHLRIRAHGTYSVVAATTPTLILRIKYGANIVALSPTITTVSGSTIGAWSLNADLVATAVGASAVIECLGQVMMSGATNNAAKAIYELRTSAYPPTAFSTAASGVLTVTAQWGTNNANNTIIGRILTIETLN